MTPRMKELLVFIEAYIALNNGIAPSYDEIRSALGLKSKHGVHRLLNSLEERGHISRLRHRARAIKLLARKDDVDSLWRYIVAKGLAEDYARHVGGHG